MKTYEYYKASRPDTTDAQIIESLSKELSDKVDVIHNLLGLTAHTEMVLADLKSRLAKMKADKDNWEAGFDDGQEYMLESVISELERPADIFVGTVNESLHMFASREKLNDIIHDCLCDGLYSFGGYGIELRWNESEYKKAKQDLIAEGQESVCFEDILMKILKNGGALKIKDIEGAGDQDAELKLSLQTYERFRKVDSAVLLNLFNEQYDSSDADSVLQTLFYGEVIFG